MFTDPIASSIWKLSLVVEEGPRPRDGDDERAHRRDFAKGRDVQMEFRRHMGLRPSRYPWPELRLDRPTAEKLLAWVEEMERSQTAHFARGFLEEIPQVERPEWYVLRPRRQDHPIERETDGVEIVNGYNVHVSNVFRSKVLQHGMTGAWFLPTQRERFRGRREWFEMVPDSAMGRGLHHPWFNPAMMRGDYWGEPVEPQARRGITYFENHQLCSAPSGMSEFLRRAIEHFPAGELRILGAARTARHHLPATDIALAPIGKPNHYDLCIRADAARMLQNERVLSTADCQPIIVLDAQDDWDTALNAPIDIQTDPTLARKRLEAEKIAQSSVAFDAAVLDYEWTPEIAIEAARREGSASRDYRPISPRKLSRALRQLPLPVPKLWQELALAVGAWGNIGECFFSSPDRWLENHTMWAENLEEEEDVPAGQYLFAGGAVSGDTFGFDLTSVTESEPYDAPLLLYDHEISRFVKRWSSITRFVEEHLRRT